MEPDISVQSLLDKIKKEGIEEANKTAEKIHEEARSKGDAIIKKAREESERMLDEARAEIDRNKEAFESSMSQAARNLLLGLKQDIIRLYDHIVERQVESALTPALMSEMILKIVSAWGLKETGGKLEVLTSQEDCKKLQELLHQSLQDEFRKGVTLRPVDGIRAGFRIGEREGTFYYDLTPKGLAEILVEYLNPRIAKYLENISNNSPD